MPLNITPGQRHYPDIYRGGKKKGRGSGVEEAGTEGDRPLCRPSSILIVYKKGRRRKEKGGGEKQGEGRVVCGPCG